MELQTYIEDHGGAYPRALSTCPIEKRLGICVKNWRASHDTMKSWKKNALNAAGFVWSVGRGSTTTASTAIRLQEHWEGEAAIKSQGVTFTKRCRDCSEEKQLFISQGYYMDNKSKAPRFAKRCVICCSKEKGKNGKRKANARWDFIGTEAKR
jgi:hypothetical protein